jgi:hypothetical protein
MCGCDFFTFSSQQMKRRNFLLRSASQKLAQKANIDEAEAAGLVKLLKFFLFIVCKKMSKSKKFHFCLHTV